MGFFENLFGSMKPIKFNNRYKITSVGIGEKGNPAFFEAIIIANNIEDAAIFVTNSTDKEIVKIEYIGKVE